MEVETRFNHQKSRTFFVLALFCFAIVLSPILTGLPTFLGPAESWAHISEHLLSQYIRNSVLLSILTLTWASLLSIPSAWFLSRYAFPFDGLLKALLILPLAIPKYMMAYAYAGLFDFSGTLTHVLSMFGIGYVDILNIFGLSCILAFALFPYIFTVAYLAFSTIDQELRQAARMLGQSIQATIFRIDLPLAIPAILGGLLLVLMETLGDYGASHYFNIQTMTVGLFRTWFGLGDMVAAIRLGLFISLSVLAAAAFVSRYQSQRDYYQTTRSTYTKERPSTQIWTSGLFFILCPIILSLVIPLYQIMTWVLQNASDFPHTELLKILWDTVYIALCVGCCATTIAFLWILFKMYASPKLPQLSFELTFFGYLIPGALLALFTLSLWFALNEICESLFGLNLNLQTMIPLIFAATIKFLSIAYRPLIAVYQSTAGELETAAFMLGVSRLKRIMFVHIPLMKGALFFGFVMVIIDFMKELPLTLLLKPDDISTLAVSAYAYASDEMIGLAAVPGCLLILISVPPILISTRLLKS